MAGNGEQTSGPPTTPPLLICVRPDGNGVTVQGPLSDKLLCWRMLTDAAAAILNYQEQPLIVPATVVPSGPMRSQ